MLLFKSQKHNINMEFPVNSFPCCNKNTFFTVKVKLVQVRSAAPVHPAGPSASFTWHFILENDTENLPSQPIREPGVLDHRQLEALALERRVVVGVDGAAHALDDHQVRLALPDQHGQTFVQAAGTGVRVRNASEG